MIAKSCSRFGSNWLQQPIDSNIGFDIYYIYFIEINNSFIKCIIFYKILSINLQILVRVEEKAIKWSEILNEKLMNKKIEK